MNDRARRWRRLLATLPIFALLCLPALAQTRDGDATAPIFALLCSTALAQTSDGDAAAPAAPATLPQEAAVFEKEIHPLLETYCLTCHSTDTQKGELDLEVFSSLDAVKRNPKVWQGV